MLKRSVTVIFALLAAAYANAKVIGTEWGLTAGVRYDRMALKNAPAGLTLSSDITYNGGLHASFVFFGVAIQPEVNYGYTKLRVGAPSSPASATAHVKVHDVEIPLLLSLRFLPVVRFNVGPVFNIMSKANYEYGEEYLMFGPVHPSLGYAVGISLCIAKKLLIDARYTGYFSNTVNEISFGNADPCTFNIRSLSGGIKIGYLF